VFIGLDSADPDLLFRWEEEGLLPALSSLRRRSLLGRVSLAPGLGSGAMWASLFTGVSPARHGRYFGRQIEGDPYRVVSFDQAAVRGVPVWLAASQAKKRVAVIDIPVAPLAESLNGIQIKDWGLHDPVFPSVRTCPPSLRHEVTERYGTEPLGSCEKPKHCASAFKEFRDLLIRRIDRKTQLTCDYLQQGGWDLFMVGFGDAHCMAHQAWHLHDVRHPSYDPEFARIHGDPVQDVYMALDRAVGRIVQHAPAPATVILFAGSGMGPNYSGNHLLDEVLRRIQGIRETRLHRSVDILKRIYRKALPDVVRFWLGPLGDRVDEMTLTGDRSRRIFYAIPHNDLSGAIRFNVAGREPNGIIERGEEYDALCETLRENLMALRNPDNGEPVVADVVKTLDHYSGQCIDQLPDLLVLWNRNQPISAIASDGIGELREARMSRRTGDHTYTAAFLACGQHIGVKDLPRAVPVESLAPTIAALLGLSLPDIDGRPVYEMCP